MWKLSIDKDAPIQLVCGKNLDYVRPGYYNYQQLSNCRGFDKIRLKYTRNHMHLLVLPHGIKVSRRIHKLDKTVYPDGIKLINSLEHRNGKDLAYALHQLDSAEMLPYKSIFMQVYDKVMGVFKKIF